MKIIRRTVPGFYAWAYRPDRPGSSGSGYPTRHDRMFFGEPVLVLGNGCYDLAVVLHAGWQGVRHQCAGPGGRE